MTSRDSLMIANLVSILADKGEQISTNVTQFGIEIVQSQVVDGKCMEVPLTNDDLSVKDAISFLNGYLAALARSV